MKKKVIKISMIVIACLAVLVAIGISWMVKNSIGIHEGVYFYIKTGQGEISETVIEELTEYGGITGNTKVETEEEQEEKWDVIPMVMVNDTLYLTTGYESTVDGRCGVMDGEIESNVDGTEIPTENNQSNFGTGYGYQYGATEGTIEIYMNGSWWIYATEEVREEMQFGDK